MAKDMKWFAALFALVPAIAQAGMAGIGNAQVDEGVFTAHLRNAYILDGQQPAIDGRWRSRFMTDYGVTDNYAVGLYVQGDQRTGDDLELDALMLEQRVELHTVAQDGLYSGFRVRYTWKDGDKKPDDAHIRLILGMPYGDWDFRINQILGMEVGEGRTAGMLVDTRVQSTYGYAQDHRAGLEALSNFGNIRHITGFDTQSHEAGPVFQGKISHGLNYEAGYRYGVSESAPSHTLRLFLFRAF